MKELLLLIAAGAVGWLVFEKTKDEKPAGNGGQLPPPRQTNPASVEFEPDPAWQDLAKLPGGIGGLSIKTGGCANCGGRHE